MNPNKVFKQQTKQYGERVPVRCTDCLAEYEVLTKLWQQIKSKETISCGYCRCTGTLIVRKT